MADIDFKALAEAALNQADTLLAEWLPDGNKSGFEWKSVNPTRSDKNAGSFSINMVKGVWSDFASGDAGPDLISLYAYLFCNEDQGEAARYLAERLSMPGAIRETHRTGGKQKKARSGEPKAETPPPPPEEKPEVKEEKPGWKPLLPVPADAPERPKSNDFRGIPQAIWTYRNRAGELLGYIARFTTSDGDKEITPLTFCRHSGTGKLAWRWMAFPEPRPLYGLHKLDAYPDAIVLLVEGEKCVDAGEQELPPESLITLTWPGGANAVNKADWSALAGRQVITWADCDMKRKKLSKADQEAGADPLAQPFLLEVEQPGVKAMAKAREHLLALGCTLMNVEIPKPGEKPDGWDIADAIAEGLKGADLLDWITQHAQPCLPPSDEAPSTPEHAGAGEGEDRAGSWYDDMLRTEKGTIAAVLANVFDVLANDRRWRGVIAFDEHALRCVKLKAPLYQNGRVGEWEATDDTQTAMWITRKYHFAPSSAIVAEAVEALARANSFHPIQDYLRSLPQWDGERRLEGWLTRYLGVEAKTDELGQYLRRAGTWFIMGMVARAMKPGCKFDYCLVLEGDQGKTKSTALNALVGDAWFGDTDLDLQNKDAMIALQGKWLYEIAEMGAIARSEEKRQKSFLSRRTDEFRPPYGRRDVKMPRQLVFAGTTNEWEWNKDPTGGRRFWPVSVGDIDIAGITADRDLLFAEALAYFESGARYWPTAEEQKRLFDPVQLQREQQDGLIEVLHDWVYKQVSAFSLATAITEGLKTNGQSIDASKMTRDLQTRVGSALRKLGCKKVEKRNGMTRFWYEPPTEKAALSDTGTPNASVKKGEYDAPF